MSLMKLLSHRMHNYIQNNLEYSLEFGLFNVKIQLSINTMYFYCIYYNSSHNTLIICHTDWLNIILKPGLKKCDKIKNLSKKCEIKFISYVVELHLKWQTELACFVWANFPAWDAVAR